MKIHGGVLAALLGLTGCQQILGIDELKGGFEERDGGKDAQVDAEIEFETPSAQECDTFCTTIKSTCSANNKASFATEGYCKGLCPHMLKTKDGSNRAGNTFDCRLRLATTAADLGSDNVDECKAAGAGGGDLCGSDCEGYCQLYEKVCGEFPGLARGATCVEECEKIPVDNTRDAIAAFSSASDTLQCRLAHLGAAAASPDTALTHCKHSALVFTSEYTGACMGTDTPSCQDFCALASKACTGDMQQYENAQDCMAICTRGLTLKTTLGADEPVDDKHDTVACRRYHIYNAIRIGGDHCEHGGPTGDGHCGKICPSYCQMAEAACGDQYRMKYPGGRAECESECATALEKDGVRDQLDQHFSIPRAKASGAAPMMCRVYRLTKAFVAPIANCAAALGGAECGN